MKQYYLTKNPYFNDGKWITGAELTGFVLHSVGVGQPDPLVFVRRWDSPDYTNAGISGFIGADEIYLTAPCLETPGRVKRMPHGGKPAVNNHYIGFEMTEPAQVRYSGTGAAFTCTDPDAARAFVRKTYANAVTLFAALCRFHGRDPLADGVILSHNEAGRRGIASGHVDPEHLWRGLDMELSMEGFRRDVDRQVHPERYEKEELDLTKQELYRLLEEYLADSPVLEQQIDRRIQTALAGTQEVPDWAKREFAAAVAAGITDGSRPNDRATRLEAALMALRAGK